jgi:glycosyltransferase involved in cell wall biosynthesis
MENNSENKIKNIGIFWESVEWGGVDSYLYNLISSDAFQKINIVIFTNKYNLGAKKLSHKIADEKIKFVYFKSLSLISSKNIFFKLLLNLLKPIFFLISILQFYFLLKKYKFEVFMGQCGGYGDFGSEMASMFAAKFLGYPVKTLVIHHACIKPIFWNTTLNLINNFLSKILTSVIFVSKATKDSVTNKSNLLDRSSNLKDLVIYNGISKNKKIKDNNIDELINKNSKDIFLIGMMSRIETYKGHIDLVKGFSKLAKSVKDKFKVYFIGEGSEEEIKNLKKIILSENLKKYFVFTGYINLDSTLIASKLDLLLSLTRTYEGFGLSIVEAMSVGTPVMATNVGAVSEYLNKNNSTLVEASNIDQITKELTNFAENKVLWDKRAEIGKKEIQERFDSEQMAKNYLNHFMQNLN